MRTHDADWYTVINPQGQYCGTKQLTDHMADRLEDRGWYLIPTAAPAITVKIPSLAGTR